MTGQATPTGMTGCLHTARAIATRATAIGETAHNEPFVVTVDAVMDALYAADAWGQAFQSAQ